MLENKILNFSLELSKTQIDIIDDKLYFSVQGQSNDKNGIPRIFTMTLKITFVECVLEYPNAQLKDLLRVDYIKVLN